ncbi:MAG: heme o synthase [Betaproteobacteria bacterium]|nr:heme o synthase [Betaproteobacteria bacterium]
MIPISAAGTATLPFSRRLAAFWRECKPRVNSLIVFTAMIGMFLAAPGFPDLAHFLAGSLGIALVAGAAAAVNCLIERHIDARMARTRGRPLPRGEISPGETLALAALVGGAGLWLLHRFVNDLTMSLTLATFLGYAVVYTVLLKPATPMNIVIGGAAGAMPPLLGWAAITGQVGPEALVLFLIIFAWTPPHFWPLACYRRADYAQAGLPMLPVTHGIAYTCRHSLYYVVLLAAISLLPFALGLGGWLYLGVVLALDAAFVFHTWRLWRHYSDALARRTFRFSILYLTLLFASLLADHFLVAI